MRNKFQLLLFAFFFISLGPYLHGYAVNGVLDLRLESFQSAVPLEGQWEIYWKEILTPTDIFDAQNYHEFPSLWKDQVVGADTLNAHGYATYRLKVILPRVAQDYELYIDDMYCSYELYVDGQKVAHNGTVGKDKGSSAPLWKPQVIDLSGKTGIVELVLNISNWQHSKGGSNQPILLSKSGILSTSIWTHTVLQSLLFVGFISVSFFFFIRFVFYSHDWASFFFALFLVVYSYRLIGTGNYLLHQWIEDYPWLIAIHFEYLSLFLSTLFFSSFVYQLYKSETSITYVRPLLIACLVFSSIVIVSSPEIFTQLIFPFFAVISIYISYGFYVFSTAVINGKRGSVFGVLSVSVVFTSFMYQMFNYVGWLENAFALTFIAHLLFLIFQSIQLYKFSQSTSISVADHTL